MSADKIILDPLFLSERESIKLTSLCSDEMKKKKKKVALLEDIFRVASYQ